MICKPVSSEAHGAHRGRHAWGGFGVEPPLREVLTDPIIQAVMRSDGVSLADLQSAIAETRRRLRRMPSPSYSDAQ